jgi:trimeric autotransporter adhesin
VSGSYGTPTGSVTLTNGSSTWGPVSVYPDGSFEISILQNQLPAGSDTLTANYNGDATYLAASGSATVTVTQSVFSLAVASLAPISPGSATSATVTVSSSTSYSGTVTLACALTSGPSNQTGEGPTCTPFGAIAPGQNGSVTINTVASTRGAFILPEFPRRNRGLAGVAALALLVLFGIPARRRSWRQILGLFVLLVALGAVSSCGGGGSSGGGGSGSGGGGNLGTASGTYTFTVTGTGNPAVSPAPTATFTLTVN